jgi:hypothetical protein
MNPRRKRVGSRRERIRRLQIKIYPDNVEIIHRGWFPSEDEHIFVFPDQEFKLSFLYSEEHPRIWLTKMLLQTLANQSSQQ